MHSVLLTDKTEKYDELLRLSVRHGFGCMKTEEKNSSTCITGATMYPNITARDKIKGPYMFGPETTLKYISFIIMFHAKLALLCAVLWETKVIITKVSWRIIKSSSTMFILQIHCHAP